MLHRLAPVFGHLPNDFACGEFDAPNRGECNFIVDTGNKALALALDSFWDGFKRHLCQLSCNPLLAGTKQPLPSFAYLGA
jgi:hypothetical protein